MKTGPDTIKVGISNDPSRRRNELQTGNPYEIEIVESFRSEFSSVIEARFQKKHKQHNVSGEHFHMSPDYAKKKLNEILHNVYEHVYYWSNDEGEVSIFSDRSYFDFENE